MVYKRRARFAYIVMTKWLEKKELGLSFNLEDFKETIDGGQAFSWQSDSDKSFVGIFGKNIARLSLENDKVFYQAPSSYKNESLKDNLLHYLDAHKDYSNIRKNLYALGDKTLSEQLDKHPSLRILNQNINECIVGFICSSSKRIVQIKQCVAMLRQKLGVKLLDDFYSLEDFDRIANTDLDVLISCKLGFRARYLKNTALKIVSDNFNTSQLETMPYAEAKSYLCGLSGIGEKVADCILLFGARHSQAFPVDTWIIKSMKKLYNIEKPKEIRAFAKDNFGEHAGYAQQLLFADKSESS